MANAPDQADLPVKDITSSRRLSCAECGSHHLRRSHAKNAAETLLRLVTPVRFHRCGDCGTRGYHLAWSAPPATRPRQVVRQVPPGRRSERRDALAARLRRRRLVVSIVIAAFLGALASIIFVLSLSD